MKSIIEMLKKKTVFTILLFIAFVLCFAVSSLFLTYFVHSDKDIDKTIINRKNIDFVEVGNLQTSSSEITSRMAQNIEQQFHLDAIENHSVSSLSQLKEYDLTFNSSSRELSSSGVYLTDSFSKSLLNSNAIFDDAEGRVKTNPETSEDLIGKYVHVADVINLNLSRNDWRKMRNSNTPLIQIEGIIVEDNQTFEWVYSYDFFYLKDGLMDTFIRNDYNNILDLYRSNLSMNVTTSTNNKIDNILLSLDAECKYPYVVDSEKVTKIENDSIVDDIKNDDIYLSFNLYQKIFPEVMAYGYYVNLSDSENYTLRNTLPHMGEKISFTIKDEDNEVLDLKDLTLKGIMIEGLDEISKQTNETIGSMFLSNQNRRKINQYTRNVSLMIKSENIKNLSSFLSFLDKFDISIHYNHLGLATVSDMNLSNKNLTQIVFCLIIPYLLCFVLVLVFMKKYHEISKPQKPLISLAIMLGAILVLSGLINWGFVELFTKIEYTKIISGKNDMIYFSYYDVKMFFMNCIEILILVVPAFLIFMNPKKKIKEEINPQKYLH